MHNCKRFLPPCEGLLYNHPILLHNTESMSACQNSSMHVSQELHKARTTLLHIIMPRCLLHSKRLRLCLACVKWLSVQILSSCTTVASRAWHGTARDMHTTNGKWMITPSIWRLVGGTKIKKRNQSTEGDGEREQWIHGLVMPNDKGILPGKNRQKHGRFVQW